MANNQDSPKPNTNPSPAPPNQEPQRPPALPISSPGDHIRKSEDWPTGPLPQPSQKPKGN